MVEMAIIVPLLLLLVFGIIEFGRAYNANISVTAAAREGVRVYAISGDAAEATARAQSAAPSLNPADMTIVLNACTPGDPTTMRISYPFDFNIPFIPLGSITLRAQGVMRCGG